MVKEGVQFFEIAVGLPVRGILDDSAPFPKGGPDWREDPNICPMALPGKGLWEAVAGLGRGLVEDVR